MTTAWDVTLVTCDQFPDLTPDDLLLSDSLKAADLRVRAAVWTNEVDWEQSPITIIRSTWDYFHKADAFRKWINETAKVTRLINDARVILWNIDKHYLRDLEHNGVKVVPTVFTRQGEECNLEMIAGKLDAQVVVVKPTISGSAFGAGRFDLRVEASAAAAHVQSLNTTRDLMIQPYVPEVETRGERSLIFFERRFSHSVIKAPFSAGAAGGKSDERNYEPTSLEVDFCKRVLAAIDTELLFARVDVVPTAAGLQLMELELIEPALFFGRAPHSAKMFAEALLRVAQPAP